MNYTYLLECADQTLYCGWTNDLDKRVKAHNSGQGAKYTKPRRPVVLVYYEEFETKEEAMRREFAIKRLTRGEKLRLIAEKRAQTGEMLPLQIEETKRVEIEENDSNGRNKSEA